MDLNKESQGKVQQAWLVGVPERLYSATDLLSQIVDGNVSDFDDLSSDDGDDNDDETRMDVVFMMKVMSWNQMMTLSLKYNMI